jgi:hypothetical protein
MCRPDYLDRVSHTDSSLIKLCSWLPQAQLELFQSTIIEGNMKRFIISTFVAALLSVAVAPAFAAPHEHNLTTNQGVKAFFEEQGNRTGGGGD